MLANLLCCRSAAAMLCAIASCASAAPSVLTGMQTELSAFDAAFDDHFGVAVAVAGDIMVVGAPDDDIGTNVNQGAAYVYARKAGDVNGWGLVRKLSASDGAAGDRFGTSVAVDGDAIAVGAPYDEVGRGAVYVFERNAGGADSWKQTRKLTAGTYGWTGAAVSVSGDTIVAGAPVTGISGAAYVFERNAGSTNGWGLVGTLSAADGTNYAEHAGFGRAVSVDGDVIAVGAPGRNVSQGEVYVFSRDPRQVNGWREVRRLYGPKPGVNFRYGTSVCLDGGVLAVGTPREDAYGQSSSAGEAYIHERDTGGPDAWGQVGRLSASDGGSANRFGRTVSADGDVVVVGAYGDSADRGAVYAFHRHAGGENQWGQIAKVTVTNAVSFIRFGTSVSIDGGVMGVGAPFAKAGPVFSAGQAYVFPVHLAVYNETGKLVSTDGSANDWFGRSVAVEGNVAVVGAYHDAIGANGEQGSAYVFERHAGGSQSWGQVKKLVAADGAPAVHYGVGVAAAGDIIAVGADGDNAARGAVYLYGRHVDGTNAWGFIQKLVASNGAPADFLGWSVAAAGDVVVAGAYGADVLGVQNAGTAYLFERIPTSSNAWRQVRQLMAADRRPYDQFGMAVAVGGDVVAVGASGDDMAATTNQGSVWVYERNVGVDTNAWISVRKVTASDGASLDGFGAAVAVTPNTLVVGAYGKDTYRGAAYIFERNMGGTNMWGQVKKLTAPDRKDYDWFGGSVAIAGDRVAVGASGKNGHRGVCYLYSRHAGGTNAWGLVAACATTDALGASDFSAVVALDGGVLLAGAPYDDIGGRINQGAAFVFETAPLTELRIAGISFTPGACVGIVSTLNQRYDLEYRGSLLSGDWQPVIGQTNIVGNGGPQTLCDPAAGPVRFYRVRERLP